MGSVIGKNVPFISSQTSFSVDETSDMTKYLSEAKPEVGHGDDYVTCLNQWTDEVTYKYLDVALTVDLEKNPLPEVADVDPPTANMADIRLEGGSDDKAPHAGTSSSPRSEFLNFSPTASDCSRTNEESEEEDKSYLELENKILQDYDQAKASRSLLSEGPASNTTSGISGIQLVLNFDATAPNPEDPATTRLASYSPNELVSAIEKNFPSTSS